jgi:hypothetical protein
MKRNQDKVRSNPMLALTEAMEESVAAENMARHFRKCGHPNLQREESEDEGAIGLVWCLPAATVVASA